MLFVFVFLTMVIVNVKHCYTEGHHKYATKWAWYWWGVCLIYSDAGCQLRVRDEMWNYVAHLYYDWPIARNATSRQWWVLSIWRILLWWISSVLQKLLLERSSLTPLGHRGKIQLHIFSKMSRSLLFSVCPKRNSDK